MKDVKQLLKSIIRECVILEMDDTVGCDGSGVIDMGFYKRDCIGCPRCKSTTATRVQPASGPVDGFAVVDALVIAALDAAIDEDELFDDNIEIINGTLEDLDVPSRDIGDLIDALRNARRAFVKAEETEEMGGDPDDEEYQEELEELRDAAREADEDVERQFKRIAGRPLDFSAV